MFEEPRGNTTPGFANAWPRPVLWLSGAWAFPLCWLLRWILSPSGLANALLVLTACLVAPLPALLVSRRHSHRLLSETRNAHEEAEQLKLQLENVRFRTAKLR